MSKRLLGFALESLVEIGRVILARLQADPALAGAASILGTVQEGLQTKMIAWQNAAHAALAAQFTRDEAQRSLNDVVRELALSLLSVTRNHPDAVVYRRYFPDGYGSYIRGTAAAITSFTDGILTKLCEETDAKLTALRERLASAREAFLAAEGEYQTRLGARDNARALAEAEKLRWARGLADARLSAQSVCWDQRPYLHSVFRLALPAKRSTSPTEPAEGEPVQPAAPETNQTNPVPAPAPPGESKAENQAG
jgi:hypothetical protein